MASKITNAALIAACEQLLTEGITYAEMDCQAAVEEAYMRCGLTRSQVDVAGSNTHYRRCYWTGTPERLCELLGIKTVPSGVDNYIVENDGGEPSKYRNDGMGNASHMGVYLGGSRTFNSSEKMGGIVVSEKFNGKKQAVSGSWNMIGLKDYVDYGLTAEQLAIIAADGNFDTANYSGAVMATIDNSEGIATVSTVVDTSDFYPVKKGCKGGAVQRLQEWLNELGYSLAVDHDFGALTQAAVMSFQSQNGLVADGVVGQKTWAALAAKRAAAITGAVG